MIRRSTGIALAGASILVSGTVLGVATASARSGTAAMGVTAAVTPLAAVNACPTGEEFGDPLSAATVAATEIQSGFHFLEGPLWVASGGFLLMSDIQEGTGPEAVQPSNIIKFTPPSTFEPFLADAGSNGLALSPDGTQLLAATHDPQNISSYALSDLSRSVVATDFAGGAFNSPNDLTVRSDGTIYFTDPNFQRAERADEQAGVTGVYRVSNGAVTLVDATVRQPNGIVLSPDEKTLYVGAYSENKIYKYTVLDDGSVSNRTTFATVATPDGSTIDCAGNLYWASFSEGRIHVLSPAGAELGTITAGTNVTNAAFGGADRQTLFITSGVDGDFGLYSADLNVPGSPY
jgi:gluconolactonase